MIVAGETSGDMHGAALINQLKCLDPGIRAFGIGREGLRREGVELVFDASEISVMGFSEVISKLPAVWSALKTIRREMRSRGPDVVVLVDFPGFNLKVARAARKLGLKVVYYISPQVWAWGSWRIRTLAATVDKMIVILPFEQEFYRRAGIDAVFVGHPLIDSMQSNAVEQTVESRKGLTLGVLPGSRTHEVERLLSPMLSVSEGMLSRIDGLEVLVSRSEGLPRKPFEPFYELGPACRVIEGKSRELMAASDAVMVASGTATLEAAILGIPMVVMYKVSALSALIAGFLISIPNVALVNVVAGRRVVPEFIQGHIDVAAIQDTLEELLLKKETARKMKYELGLVASLLGEPGASRRAAEVVLDLIDS
jgi:lipid-A-disaccharide synthase